MHMDIANKFLSILHQFAEESGYSTYASAEKMAEHLGVTDRQKIRNVIRLLESRSLVHVVWLRDPSLCLSEEGALFLESGNALAEQVSSGGAVNIDESTHFHGPISGSAVSIRSTGGSQNVSSGMNAEDIIKEIVAALAKDLGLTKEAREDHIIDAENLERELKKHNPNKVTVNAYLSKLGSVASIAGLVASLIALL